MVMNRERGGQDGAPDVARESIFRTYPYMYSCMETES